MDEDRNVSAAGEAWSRLLRRTVLLLAIWFLVGPLLGILLVEPLNALSLGGLPLGFWISQQGSIYVFIILIFAYALMGDRLDRDSHGRAAGGAPTGGFTGREG